MRILSLAPLAGPGFETLCALGEVTVDAWSDHVPIQLHAADQLIARLAGIDVLIVEADHISADVLDGSALRVLGVCRGDPKNVDVDAATRNGVAVLRTPGRNANAVADLTIGLIFCLLRGIVAADDDVRAARWVVDGRLAQQRYAGREFASCVIGLVGCGEVGRAVAHRAHALGASVLAYDPVADLAGSGVPVEHVRDLGLLMERADVISVHAPLVPATRGMLGAAEFGRARPGTLFVNTARYGIADERALLAALRSGQLGGAAFDHFEHEFLAADHPLVTMPGVVLTPHIGGTTRETVANHTEQIARGVTDILAGRIPAGVVNPSVLTR